MQKGAARSAAVLQGVFPNGALATGSMGQNLFLEGRDLGKRNLFPGFRGYLSSFKPESCFLELCSSHRKSVLDAESACGRHWENSPTSDGLAALDRSQYIAY